MMSMSPASSADCSSTLPRKEICSRCVACDSTDRVSVHYDALSCHGCKAFFRRTIFEQRIYRCDFDKNCDVTDENRNQCRACRYEKCLRGGMNPKSVRGIRLNKRRTQNSIETDDDSITRRLMDLEELLETDLVPKKSQLQQRIIEEFAIPNVILSKMNYNCERVMEDDDLTDGYYRSFLLLSEWAGEIAEFRILSQADQNFMVFGWLHFIYRTVTLRQERIGLTLGNGAYLPYEQEERDKLAKRLYSAYGNVGVKLIDMVVKPMIEMDVDTKEYVLLKAMALFQPEHQLSAHGQTIISRMRDVLLAALATQTDRCVGVAIRFDIDCVPVNILSACLSDSPNGVMSYWNKAV